MTVATPVQPNRTVDSGAQYPANIDAALAVVKTVGDQFAVHEQATPNMTARVEGGVIFRPDRSFGVASPNSTATLTAPTTNPRKDVVYVDVTTLAIGTATGTEAASPVDPAVPANKIPLARINWTVGMASITNSKIDDLRQLLVSLDALLQAANIWLSAQDFSPGIFIGDSATKIGQANALMLRRAAADDAVFAKMIVEDSVTHTIKGGPSGARQNLVFSNDAGGSYVFGGPLDLSPSGAGQIKFPATQNASSDANTLDDYEEGTWTPGLSFNSGTTGITYGTQFGNYTKIGIMVTLIFRMPLTNKGSSTGPARLTGYPFTILNNLGSNGVGGALNWNALATSKVFVSAQGAQNDTVSELRGIGAAATSSLTSLVETDFSNTTLIEGTIIYFV